MQSKAWVAIFAIVDQIKRLRSLGRRVQYKLGTPKKDGFEVSAPRIIPKKIWIYWDQGVENAPEIVQMCVKSWHEKNPDWDITLIDKSSVDGVVEMPDLSGDIPVQAFADLLRLRLLNLHGGVWVDATGYCVRPLDEWLPVVAQTGYFSFFWTPDTRWFMWPSYTREVANWFLAAEAGNPVISNWEDYSFRYWDGRKKTNQYFWPHTLFETLTYIRQPFRKALKRVPILSCMGPHLVHDCIFRKRDISRVSEIIDSGAAPVQKLRWQWDEEKQSIVKQLLHIKD